MRLRPREIIAGMPLGAGFLAVYFLSSSEATIKIDFVDNARAVLDVPSEWISPIYSSSNISVIVVDPLSGKLSIAGTGHATLCAHKSAYELETKRCRRSRVRLW